MGKAFAVSTAGKFRDPDFFLSNAPRMSDYIEKEMSLGGGSAAKRMDAAVLDIGADESVGAQARDK